MHTKCDRVKNNKPVTVSDHNKAIVTHSETLKPSRKRNLLELFPKCTTESGQSNRSLVYLSKKSINTREIKEMLFDIFKQ